MTTPFRSFTRRLAFGLAILAPLAQQYLATMTAVDTLNKATKPKDETPETTKPGPESGERPEPFELAIGNFDFHNIEAARYKLGSKSNLPEAGKVAEVAFRVGLANREELPIVIAPLVDDGGPRNFTLHLYPTGRELAQLDVLRHDLAEPDKAPVSRDEAARFALRRGLDILTHKRHGMLPGGLVAAEMGASPLFGLG